jgi:hypothetical protein
MFGGGVKDATVVVVPMGSEAIEYKPEETMVTGVMPRYRSRRCALVAVITAVLFSIILTVSLLTTSDKRKRRGSEPTSPSSLLGPPEWDLQERYRVFRARAGQVTMASLLIDPNSIQYKALNWLVYQDRYMPTNQTFEDFVQRYAVMIFLYSCSGSNWRSFVAGDEGVAVDGVVVDAMSVENIATQSECDFDGFGCNSEGHLTTLSLSEQSIYGTLPDEIGLLSHLRYLDVSKNELKGSLPSTIYNMTNLGK